LIDNESQALRPFSYSRFVMIKIIEDADVKVSHVYRIQDNSSLKSKLGIVDEANPCHYAQ